MSRLIKYLICMHTYGTMCNTYSMKQLHTFCRGTDMERHRRNATEELRDCRRQGDRKRRMVARQQKTYVRCSQRLAGESQWHAQETEEHSSKQTFDSIYRYRHRETRLSTLRLKAALIAFCEASCILYVCTSIYTKGEFRVPTH